MIRTIKSFLTTLILSIAFFSCDKEVSLENGGTAGGGGGGGTSSGTAVYSWAGAPGTCATPVISGSYVAGTALGATNTVVLSVDVTTIGTYNVTTGTANGISFASSGTFTITGPQIIILTATGTPTTAGTNTFIPGTTGCAFTITTTAVPAAPPAVGTLNCATATTAGTYTQGISLTGTNTVTIPVNVTTGGTYSVTTVATNGVTFSGSGTLALGNQSILLTGSGLPVNAGAISFPVSLGASSCNFSITFLAGTPPAVGTLDCAAAVLAGTYTQGVALAASNTITIPVNVTIGGPYSVTTTATNGVTFSGSGTLALGNQSIVLTGSGTPTNSGTVSIPVSLGASSCNVDITFIAGSTDFLKCSINGSAIINFANVSGSLDPGSFAASGDSGGQDLQIGVTDLGGGTIGTGTYHNVSLTNMTVFCIDQLLIGTTIWSDATGTANIFTLNITTVTPTTVTGTFSGNLVDPTPGGSTKVITNGSFSITY